MIKVVVGIIVVVIALSSGGVFFITRYLQTPEFKERVLSEAREAAGTEVEVAELDISIWRGIALEGVMIADPSGLSTEFFRADRLILRHRVLPLLRRQVQIDRLFLDTPMVTLVQGEEGGWNFEQFFSPSEEPGAEPAADLEERSGGEGSFDVTLSEFSISDAEISMLNPQGGVMTQLHDLDLVSSITFVEERLEAEGTLSVGTVNFGESLLVSSLRAPVLISPEEIRFSPVSGELAGGEFSGDIVLNTAPEFRYRMDIEVTGADVKALLQGARVEAEINGKLQASVRVEGSGGLSSMVGQGLASVVGGRVSQLPAQQMVASLLQVPSLEEIDFEECVVEFTLGDNILETTVIRLLSPLVQVTGRGSVSLEHNTLDHDMMLALSEEMLSGLPAPLLKAFSRREDGFYTLEFRLWGAFNSPQTDLQQKITRGAAEGLLEQGLKGLRNLFR
jgi:uncharacterized protein involved in outer membrane biogenesis